MANTYKTQVFTNVSRNQFTDFMRRWKALDQPSSTIASFSYDTAKGILVYTVCSGDPAAFIDQLHTEAQVIMKKAADITTTDTKMSRFTDITKAIENKDVQPEEIEISPEPILKKGNP